MDAEQQRPYYDPNAKNKQPDDDIVAVLVVAEQPRRDCVTWVYNWIEKRYVAYRGEESQQSKTT